MNNYMPHVLVLCEDEANRQIAIGFLLDPALNPKAIQVLKPAGGWLHVRDDFEKNHIASMAKCRTRYMVLIIDFDGDEDRLAKMKAVVPADLADRVFVLGALMEPEDLRKANLGKWEEIGLRLAADCRENTRLTWNHALLKHNAEELNRMTPILKPILFS